MCNDRSASGLDGHRMSYDLTEYAEKLRELYENTFEKTLEKAGRNQTCLSENRIGNL